MIPCWPGVGVRRADRRAGSGCIAIGPTPPAIRPIAHVPRLSWAMRSDGTMRTTWSTPATWISPLARAGARSTLYEMACNTVKEEIESVALHAVPYGGVSEPEQAILLAPPHGRPRRRSSRCYVPCCPSIRLPISIARHRDAESRNRPAPHCRCAADRRRRDRAWHAWREQMQDADAYYEDTNALGWFYDTFDHPRRLRLLYIAEKFVNMTAWHQKLTNAFAPTPIHPPGGAARLDPTNFWRGSTLRSAP